MMAEGLWRAKARHEPRVHQTRERRARVGELVQIDGSPHDWFEGRAAKCSLIGFLLCSPAQERKGRRCASKTPSRESRDSASSGAGAPHSAATSRVVSTAKPRPRARSASSAVAHWTRNSGVSAMAPT